MSAGIRIDNKYGGEYLYISTYRRQRAEGICCAGRPATAAAG
jgi:hypothetical protein